MSLSQADFMAKANRALGEARTLLDAGGYEGACNRAYYAMFDAAKAALMNTGGSVSTHNGLIRMFGLKLVNSGLIRPEYGRILSQMESLRDVADYGVANVEPEKAQWAVEQAQNFVSMVQEFLAQG